MRSNFLLAAAAAQVVSVRSATPTAQEPCAQVSAALNPQLQNQYGYIQVDPDVAYACLKSVPLDKAGDLKQLNGLKTLSNFQSNLVYLKNPPPGWLYPGVDFQGVVEGIISKLQNDGYETEYDVQLDIYDLITSAHDFHLTYTADIMDVFTWWRQAYLVSVSVDGTSLPNVYDYADMAALAGVNGSSYKPSPIVQINDTDVEEWLNQYATFNPWDHDPDSNYNNLMFSPPRLIYDYVGFSEHLYHFPGRETVFKFANGSSKEVPTYAGTQQDFSGVTDGASFFQKFCSGPQASASASARISFAPSSVASSAPAPSGPAPSGSGSVIGSASAISSSSVLTNNLFTALSTPLPALPAPTIGFPKPAVITGDEYMGGYFPEDVPELAVVSMPSFDPNNDYSFQNAFRTILATAKSLGKTKLIIDLRGNGGGTVVDALSLFTQLFPSKTPYAASNMAAWPLFNVIGQVTSGYNSSEIHDTQTLSEFSYTEDLTISLDDYDSWADFYGPVETHGGTFTNLRRYNYSSPANALGNPFYGYGNDTNPQPQTFMSENIVMLSDGCCGSTCAIFAELLKTQGGVKSIAVGGRKQTGPMQPVGGSKGANDQDLQDLGAALLQAYGDADADEKAIFAPYLKAGLQENAEQYLGRRAQWNPDSNVNFQNNIRKDDDSVTPLMFVYEAANCRFFYTPQMILDQSLVWTTTYNLAWGNGTCVEGSTDQPSAVTGWSTTYIGSPAPEGADNFFGANITWSYPSPVQSSPSGSASASASGSAPGSPPAASSNAAASASRNVPRLVSGTHWIVSGAITGAFSIGGIVLFLL